MARALVYYLAIALLWLVCTSSFAAAETQKRIKIRLLKEGPGKSLQLHHPKLAFTLTPQLEKLDSKTKTYQTITPQEVRKLHVKVLYLHVAAIQNFKKDREADKKAYWQFVADENAFYSGKAPINGKTPATFVKPSGPVITAPMPSPTPGPVPMSYPEYAKELARRYFWVLLIIVVVALVVIIIRRSSRNDDDIDPNGRNPRDAYGPEPDGRSREPVSHNFSVLGDIRPRDSESPPGQTGAKPPVPVPEKSEILSSSPRSRKKDIAIIHSDASGDKNSEQEKARKPGRIKRGIRKLASITVRRDKTKIEIPTNKVRVNQAAGNAARARQRKRKATRSGRTGLNPQEQAS